MCILLHPFSVMISLLWITYEQVKTERWHTLGKALQRSGRMHNSSVADKMKLDSQTGTGQIGEHALLVALDTGGFGRTHGTAGYALSQHCHLREGHSKLVLVTPAFGGYLEPKFLSAMGKMIEGGEGIGIMGTKEQYGINCTSVSAGTRC